MAMMISSNENVRSLFKNWLSDKIGMMNIKFILKISDKSFSLLVSSCHIVFAGRVNGLGVGTTGF